MRGWDVRAVANLVLDEGRRLKRPITNLHINKILFFMHVDCLRDRNHPLISAKIEAWEHGPVFREVYNQFKRFGKNEISSKALVVDFDSGERVEAKLHIAEDLEAYVRKLASFYAEVPASVLVDLSHEKGGAWDKAWNHDGAYNVGMEITNLMIQEFELSKQRKIKQI